MAQPQRNGTGNNLDRAKASLAETQARLAALATERDTALLRGTDADVAKVDAEIEAVRRTLRTHTDRVRLLEAEAEQVAAEKRAKEKAALISRIEAKLAERDRVGAELVKHIEAADRCFLKMLALGRECASAWPWASHDLAAVFFAQHAVQTALQHEIYRISGRPQPGGGLPNTAAGPSFPGGRAERLEWIMQPSRTTPLVEKLFEASAVASKIMRTGRSTNYVEPQPAVNGNGNGVMPVERSVEQEELARLMVRQHELAMSDDPADEPKYQEIGRQIAALSTAEMRNAQ